MIYLPFLKAFLPHGTSRSTGSVDLADKTMSKDVFEINTLEIDPDDSAEINEILHFKVELAQDTNTSTDKGPQAQRGAQKNPEYTLPAPTVSSEATRLHDQHQLWLGALKGRLSISHIPVTAKRILEVGGGTGDWCRDFALAHPNIEVIAIDAEEIARSASTPRNCHYFVYDAEADWDDFAILNGPFDFIHLRCMGVVFHDWSHLFAQCFDRLVPGGWIEVQDIKYPVRSLETFSNPLPALLRGYSHMPEICMTRSVDIMAVNHFEEYFRDRGFVNIKEESPQMAIGQWPKGEEQKKIGSEQLKMFFQPHWQLLMSMMYEKALHWTPAAVEKLVDEVRQDVLVPGRHYYHQL